MNILKKIVRNKLKEVAKLKQKVPLSVLKARILKQKIKTSPFKKAISSKRGIGVIAEIKPKSPSAGRLIKTAPFATAKLYAKSRADAVSVLTDKEYFGGEIALIKEIKKIVKRPVIRKDFIVDPYQVYESLNAGADAILLIAGILSKRKLGRLLAISEALGLDVIVETHGLRDLKKALSAGAGIIGINNRDLKTMKINLGTTEKLIKLIPKSKIVVSESGIESRSDALRLKKTGVDAVLVGTAILKSINPVKFINNLKV